MISIQAFRISVELFQFKLINLKPKNSTYDDKSRGKGGKEKISLKGGKFGFNLKIILLFFLLGVNINNTFSKVCQVSNNRINHTINGNISKKGTRIVPRICPPTACYYNSPLPPLVPYYTPYLL